MKVSTSVLTVTDNKKETIDLLNQTSTDYLHLDVMDGKFVPNNTVVQMNEVLPYNTRPLDIHLMVEDVILFIEKYRVWNPSYITFHVEIQDDILAIIHRIKRYGIKAGLALNPGTDLSMLLPYLAELDLVLVMSVPAGYGGQPFVETTPDTIGKLEEIRDTYQYHYKIEVDGGINDKTISQIRNADIVVSGSYIMNGNYEERITNLRKG